jgi:hypothetical protein
MEFIVFYASDTNVGKNIAKETDMNGDFLETPLAISGKKPHTESDGILK